MFNPRFFGNLITVNILIYFWSQNFNSSSRQEGKNFAPLIQSEEKWKPVNKVQLELSHKVQSKIKYFFAKLKISWTIL